MKRKHGKDTKIRWRWSDLYINVILNTHLFLIILNSFYIEHNFFNVKKILTNFLAFLSNHSILNKIIKSQNIWSLTINLILYELDKLINKFKI